MIRLPEYTLKHGGGCDPAIKWLGGKSYRDAYETCPRGDWLLWLVHELKIDLRKIALAACECIELGYKFLPDGEYRARIAVETWRAWVRGEATLEEVRSAADAAHAAFQEGRRTPGSRILLASWAIDKFPHAIPKYLSGIDPEKSTDIMRQCADIVRKHITWGDIEPLVTTIEKAQPDTPPENLYDLDFEE